MGLRFGFDALTEAAYPERMRDTSCPFIVLLTASIALLASMLTLDASAQSNREPGHTPDGERPAATPQLRTPEPRKSEPRKSEPSPATAAPTSPRPGAAAKKKQSPPDTPEAREKALSNLYAHLATASDPSEASAIAAAIEALWAQSGSDTVALLLTRATQATIEKKSDLARQLFDAVVELAPDFAEGFARRAFFHYRENDATSALGDLRRALALEPNHYRALDGLSTILKDIGEKRAALKALQQLERVHPHWPGLADELKELERAVEGQGI